MWHCGMVHPSVKQVDLWLFGFGGVDARFATEFTESLMVFLRELCDLCGSNGFDPT